ncbi:MAG: hypothetical protein H6739_00640 [Alphaproteobacteria bacterium]|nr:hypothetical protein [Alphaproteobacteria bacterium]
MQEDASSAKRHAQLRWVGVPLFGLGLLGLVGAAMLGVTTEAGWDGVMLYIATSGLSLATFGTHNDTALAMAFRASSAGALSDEALRRELDEEIALDRRALVALSPTPRVAFAVTLIALTLHLFGLRWLTQAI